MLLNIKDLDNIKIITFINTVKLSILIFCYTVNFYQLFIYVLKFTVINYYNITKFECYKLF